MMIDLFPKNIKRWELEASQTAARNGIDNRIPNHLIRNAAHLAHFLQKLRDKIKEKTGVERLIIITSGYRSPELNKRVGGSKNSAHMSAMAADIRVPGMSPASLTEFIVKNMRGYDQVINEFDSWVHIAVNPDCEENRHMAMRADKVSGKVKYSMIDDPEAA